jgi:hypothetical protein
VSLATVGRPAGRSMVEIRLARHEVRSRCDRNISVAWSIRRA